MSIPRSGGGGLKEVGIAPFIEAAGRILWILEEVGFNELLAIPKGGFFERRGLPKGK